MSSASRAIGGGSLRTRLRSASVWTLANTLGAQVIRFGSNLILTRLLFPEAFGLMALVNAIGQGVQMFSDFGVGPAVVQARDANPRLLNVACTVQIVRGWSLFGILLLLAAPISLGYDEPMLLTLVPAIGLSSVIRGYASTTQFTFARDLRVREQLFVELGSQLVGLVVSVAASVIWRSVWALVFGTWATALAFTYLSYALDRSHTHRLCWDKELLGQIARFGRWVMASTMLSYLLLHGDRLVLAKFMSFAHLGLYQIAAVISGAASQLTQQLSRRVLFPAYAEFGQETTPELLRRIRKIRMAVMSGLLPVCWVLAIFGDLVVKLLWDPRYHGAGWMVQALSAGGVFWAFGVGPLFLARGEPWIGLALNVLHASVLFPALWLAGSIMGPDGLIYAYAASPFFSYVTMIWTQTRYKVWMPSLELAGMVISAAVIGLGLWLRSVLGF